MTSRLYRLGAAFLLVMLALVSQSASASFPPQITYLYSIWNAAASVYEQPSASAACAAMVAKGNAAWNGNPVASFQSATETVCYYSYHYTGGAEADSQLNISKSEGPAQCPAGSTLSGSLCTCTSPAVENATHDGCTVPVVEDRCKGIAALDSTAFGDRSITVPGKVSSGPACLPDAGSAAGKGCTVDFQRSASYQKANGDWLSEGSYRYGSGSSTCSTASTAPGSSTSTITPVPATVNPCPNGQPGQVNGVDVCIPFSSAPGATETTKTKTESVTPPGGGPETQTSTTETTKCEGGTCTTTSQTTVTSGSSTSVTTSTTAQSKGDYCEKNKQAVECGGSGKGSGWGGSCTAGFSCDGDAVQCALTREVHRQNCLLNKPTDESHLYDDARVKTGNQTTELPGNETKNITSSSFDSSDAIGGGGRCVSDITLNFPFGGSMLLPMSSVCPHLDTLRYALMAIAWVTAFAIVARRS